MNCKLFFILLFTTIWTSKSFAQEKKQLQLHDKKFSQEIEEGLKDGSLRKSSAAYYYTYIGAYQDAIKTYELPIEWGMAAANQEDLEEFEKYKTQNAYDYLIEASKKAEILIISEAHQKPQHRIFTMKLLKRLYDNGYRYLGLETLTPSYVGNPPFLMDTLMQKRGYALNGPLSGFYIREAQMANLVREALNIGFELFAYEKTNQEQERDLVQAKNIENFRKQHPEGKLLIHCGWYHAIESDFPKYQDDNYMAYHLKKLTGIDPLTIYQDALSEKGTGKESPYFKKTKAKKVSVLINKKQEVFNGIDEKAHFDILVYHPRTRYKYNRPHWLKDIPENRFVKIDKKALTKLKFPVIIEARFQKEGANAAPVDVVELKNIKDKSRLVLRPGHYTIRATDYNKQEISYNLILSTL